MKTEQGLKNRRNNARISNMKRRGLLGKTRLSSKDIDYIKKRDGFQCIYCNSPNELTIDHFKSIKKGGLDEIHNCVTACIHCNCSKKSRNALLWANEKGYKLPEYWRLLCQKTNK